MATPAEIQALIDINETAEAELRVELKEALAKIVVDGLFVKLLALKDGYDAEELTAVATLSGIETLLRA